MTRQKNTPSQGKAESITVRLDPKIRYGLELLARKQHRNLSSVVEWALQKAINDPEQGLIEKGKDKQEFHLLPALWDVEESDRLYQMATMRADLLTFEEERLVKTIIESDYFNYLSETHKDLIDSATGKTTSVYHQKMRSSIREHFQIFKKVSNGELSKDALPKPPRGWSRTKIKSNGNAA